jgi:hypothetical protein
MSYLPEWLSRAITPESDEEKLANISIRPDYYGEKTSVIAQEIYENRLPSTAYDFWSYDVAPVSSTGWSQMTPAPKMSDELSWWDELKIAIMPESYGEAMANKIINAPVGTPVGQWDIEDFSSPNVFVKAKGTIKEAASDIASGSKMLGIYVVILLVVLVAVNAFVRR